MPVAGRRRFFVIPCLLFLFSILSTNATNLTASTDYGYGPLWIDYADEDLQRCQNVSFTFGGGFGPYVLGEMIML